MFAGDIAGGECRLQVVAPGLGIDVHHLAAEIQPGYQARGHGARVYLLEGNTTGSDHSRS